MIIFVCYNRLLKCIRYIKCLTIIMSYGTYRKVIGGAIQWQLHGDEICFFVFAFMRTLVSYIIVSECVTGVLFTLLK